MSGTKRVPRARRAATAALVMLVGIAGPGRGLAGASAGRGQAPEPPRDLRVDVQVFQKLAFEAAQFTVKIEVPGWQMEGQPRIRPFYGHATLMPDTTTKTGFAFLWDVPGAIRAARGPLRRTSIHIHWTIVPDPPRDAQGTPILTVFTVSLSPTGEVTVAEVHSSGPEATVVGDPTATQPFLPAEGAPPTSAVCRLRVDEGGTVRFQVWVVGEATLVGDPGASASVGQARAATSPEAQSRIDVEWRRPERERREAVPVGLVVTWTARTARETFLGGRTVVELIAGKTEAGVAGVTTTTRLMPPPAGPATRPSPAP